MKIFKIILISVLLFSMSFGVFSQDSYLSPNTLRTADIQDGDLVGDITLELPPYWQNDRHRWNVRNDDEPETLDQWFKDLSLDEKVEIYNWWKYESVNLEIDSEYGEIFFRFNKECIKMPLIIEQYNTKEGE